MADTSGEEDIKLQRSSAAIIADFESSLPKLLWKDSKIRDVASCTKADQLAQLLDQFQEWPQLLDPHLAEIVQSLSGAFLAYLSKHPRHYTESTASFITRHGYVPGPLPRAVCKILYSLCKVRGRKVICNLLDNEPRHLELMLTTFQVWDRIEAKPRDDAPGFGPMTWEERYVMLLWLSHLMLAPFDFISLISYDFARDSGFRNSQTHALNKPSRDIADFAQCTINTCLKYLQVASKESEAARMLLVRLVLRTDMIRVGIHKFMIRRSLGRLESSHDSGDLFESIGNLSFIGAFLVSAPQSITRPFLEPIHLTLENINNGEGSHLQVLKSNAVVRKLIIKILRQLALGAYPLWDEEEVYGEMLQGAISYLLDALSHSQTLVRFAASKAISVIAFRLGSAMASQVVEEILDDLERDLRWYDYERNMTHSFSSIEWTPKNNCSLPRLYEPNFSIDSATKWHGKVLTLSQLLFRHSLPATQLARTINIVILALDFNQKSPTGVALGSNVRDAACFGLWALAKNYGTKELVAIEPVKLVRAYQGQGPVKHFILQALADTLVSTACLDPSGNIRRAASAALQEMVGRHPDKINAGIAMEGNFPKDIVLPGLVQIVDYHAIALRQKAMQEVALRASRLAHTYWDVLQAGLSDWRGLKASDAETRRLAAHALGNLAVDPSYHPCDRSKPEESLVFDSSSPNHDLIFELLRKLQSRLGRYRFTAVFERHGLLFAMGEIVRTLQQANFAVDRAAKDSDSTAVSRTLQDLWIVPFKDGFYTTEQQFEQDASKGDRSIYTHEARCFFFNALASSALDKKASTYGKVPEPNKEERCLWLGVIDVSLRRSEDLMVSVSSKAAELYVGLLPLEEQHKTIVEWKNAIVDPQSGVKGARTFGLIRAIGLCFKHCIMPPKWMFRQMTDLQLQIIRLLTGQAKFGNSIDVKCTSLQSLADGPLQSSNFLQNRGPRPVGQPMLYETLIVALSDYTIDQRGDIGSYVRMAAILAAGVGIEYGLFLALDPQQEMFLITRICSLAIEKLDRVRLTASLCLQRHWKYIRILQNLPVDPPVKISDIPETRTSHYFLQYLKLNAQGWYHTEFLTSFVKVAGDSSESLLAAARKALVNYATSLDALKLFGFFTSLNKLLSSSEKEVPVLTIEVFGFLLESNVLRRLETYYRISWGEFVDVAAGVMLPQLGSRSLKPGVTWINFLYGLSTVEAAKGIALNRLCDLMWYPLPQLRVKAAEVMFLATPEYSLAILDVSLEGNDGDLMQKVHRLRERVARVYGSER